MSGKSPLAASAEQRDGLRRLAVSANRAEADRARAILLSLSGLKSAAIGEVCGVREDTVRIPTKPATHSNRKPATDSDLKPAGVPI